MTNIPEQLRYTAQHEWATITDSSMLRVGITDFAQDALGDIVYVDLAEPGTQTKAEQTLGEVESTKSVSDIYAPFEGTVATRNETLGDNPELINTDPYGEGWLVEFSLPDGDDAQAALETLLDAAAYRELLATQQ